MAIDNSDYPDTHIRDNKACNVVYSKMSILGANGGTLFDYYLDKGVRTLNIYVDEPYVDAIPLLCEQAFWLGIELEGVYSVKPCNMGINIWGQRRPKTLKVQSINIRNISSAPFVTIGQLRKRIINERQIFTHLTDYSLYKRTLLDKVLQYKNDYAPNMSIAILSFPSAVNIKNPSEWETNCDVSGHLNRDKLPTELERLGFESADISRFLKGGFFPTIRKHGVWFAGDIKTQYINSAGGYRVTVPCTGKKESNIYFFGASTLFGYGCFDEFTIPSVIQKELNQYYDVCNRQCVNCANGAATNYYSQYESFLYHSPQSDDVVCFVDKQNMFRLIYENYKNKVLFIRPHEDDGLLDRPHDYGEVYTNTTQHFNNTGNELLGKYYAKKMIENGIFEKQNNKTDDLPIRLSKKIQKDSTPPELSQYLESVKKKCPRIGAIVMNCNPFTNGHRYLIEESAKKVSSLIIFVVEEDKSFFKFQDRLKLVQAGTEDLSNVSVIPSGGFIISQTTFGAYFEKDYRKDEQIDPTDDLVIFAQHIAPTLGITVRFAGEEPLDNITQQYNDAMERILPQYGIAFEVIPRKTSDGTVISASRVRKLLKEKKFDEIAKIVPQSTLDYLINAGKA